MRATVPSKLDSKAKLIVVPPPTGRLADVTAIQAAVNESGRTRHTSAPAPNTAGSEANERDGTNA